MKHKLLFSLSIFTGFLLFFPSCNNKQPYKPDYKTIGGIVIGKETCNTIEDNDYWLIDFTVYPNNPPHIGDTLLINGITYTNVLKVKGLQYRLKQVGIEVAIDYNKIGKRELTSGCRIDSPVVYNLKEIFIINQFEIR